MPFGWFSKREEPKVEFERHKPCLEEKMGLLTARGRVNVARLSKIAAENALYKEASHMQISRYIDGLLRGESALVMENRTRLNAVVARKIDKLMETQIDLEIY